MINFEEDELKQINNKLDELQQGFCNFKSQLSIMSKPSYTTEETLKILGVSAPTLRKWRLEGLIGYSQVGSIILYSQEDISNFLKTNHIDPIPS